MLGGRPVRDEVLERGAAGVRERVDRPRPRGGEAGRVVGAVGQELPRVEVPAGGPQPLEVDVVGGRELRHVDRPVARRAGQQPAARRGDVEVRPGRGALEEVDDALAPDEEAELARDLAHRVGVLRRGERLPQPGRPHGVAQRALGDQPGEQERDAMTPAATRNTRSSASVNDVEVARRARPPGAARPPTDRAPTLAAAAAPRPPAAASRRARATAGW